MRSLASVGIALLLIASPTTVSAQPTLTPDWRGGALHIHGVGFQSNEPVTLTVALDGAPRTLTAEAGPDGTFSLSTEMAAEPGTHVDIAAHRSDISDASTTVVAPQDLGPRQPVRLLPATSQESGGIADVTGPGQSVSRPDAQCPRTITCDYAERNMPDAGYRLQSLRICGANCTTQYWVSGRDDGQQLLELDPVRGGAVIAVAGSSASHPPVRVVTPQYAPGDPACCPSGFADTTYTWDALSSALRAGQPVVTPASEFPGWDEVRRELQTEGWVLAGVGDSRGSGGY